MTKGTNLPQAPSSCDTPIDKNLELGQRYNVQGTPNIVLTDGTRLPGYVPAAQLSKMLDQQAKAK
jgi:thiol:disulfide interchange protein DsbC